MRIICTLLLYAGLGWSLQAQARHVPGEILIQLTPDAEASRWMQQSLEKSNPSAVCIQNLIPVAASLQIWKVQFDAGCIPEEKLLQLLRQDPSITTAQFNHFVELRGTTPNDPLFPQQWQWQNHGQNGGIPGLDIGLSRAWDISTGGVTPRGDSIVVAIIDTGIDTNHADLRPNLWHNQHEIPNNGKDDDLNGHIGDYRGWNSQRFNGNVFETALSGHGTGVAGIVGAKGNNGLGGSGVNWKVKLMPVVWGGETNGTEEVVIRGFAYVHTQRKLYNESNGQKGAYVVAVNASWGIPRLRSADYPLWCNLFDSLGQQGVVTVNAAAKDLVNSDEMGDLPSGCPSEYLLVVTNINNQGKLTQAYGPNTVDLAAPATDILSTRVGEGYRKFSGTSFAAPQVAGAIALLYASPCAQLANLAREVPKDAALLARKLILDGVEPLSDLTGKIVSGGYLRVDKSSRLLAATYCPVSPPARPELMVRPNPFHEELVVPLHSTQIIAQANLEVFNLQGQKIHSQVISIPADYPELIKIDANDWPAGVYILRLMGGGKEMAVQKVVKI